MHRKGARSLERVAADNHRVGLVVDVLHLIDVGGIGEDIVLSRLITGEVMGAGRCRDEVQNDCEEQGEDEFFHEEFDLEMVGDASKCRGIEWAEYLVLIFVVPHNGYHCSIVGGEFERREENLPMVLLAQSRKTITHTAVG